MGRIGIINCYQFVSSLPRVRRGALSVKPLHKVFEEYVRLKEQSQAEVGRAIFGEGDGSARLRSGLYKWAARRELDTAAVREAAAAVSPRLACPPRVSPPFPGRTGQTESEQFVYGYDRYGH